MTDSQFPQLRPEVLRDNASSARVERIWQRLDADLAGTPLRPRTALWWAPAAVVIIFGCGVFVGVRWSRVESAASQPTAVMAEPIAVAEPAGIAERPRTTAVTGHPADDRQPAPRVRGGRELTAVPVPEAARPEVSEPPAPPAPVPAGPPEWQRLFNLGEFDAARRELQQQGGFAAGFDAALRSASPDQMVNLADIAARAGDRPRAVEALRRVIGEHAGDPVAPLAAYKLGNLLERLGDRAGAAEAFAAYRRLSPTGDLAEDALARQVDVAIERGNLERARELAEQYAKDFPNGRRLSDFREQLVKLGAQVAAPSESDSNAAQPAEEMAEEPDPGSD